MGQTACIAIVAVTLLAACPATARPAYVDPRVGYGPPAYAEPGYQRTFVPAHWERRGPHWVWVEAQWVVTPRNAGRGGPHGHAGPGGLHGHAGPGAPQWHGGPGPRRDLDRDGVPDRYDRDRDGDGVPNRYDRAPDSRRWR